jgi:hypothetical protein
MANRSYGRPGATPGKRGKFLLEKRGKKKAKQDNGREKDGERKGTKGGVGRWAGSLLGGYYICHGAYYASHCCSRKLFVVFWGPRRAPGIRAECKSRAGK